MSTTELFKKHFGNTAAVDMKHPNMESFFEELNAECLEEDKHKNCNIPCVVGRSEQLSCPRCRHTGIDTDKDGLNYCRSCSHYWRAT